MGWVPHKGTKISCPLVVIAREGANTGGGGLGD